MSAFPASLPQDVAAIFAEAEKKLGRDVDFTNVYKYLDTFWESEKPAG